MMRLPYFRYRAPREIDEAVTILAEEGPDAMLLGGGTDLLPNMKRRQQVPQTLVALRNIEALRTLSNGSGMRLGAGLTLSELTDNDTIRKKYRGLWLAASQIATPHLRNMGTLGGNICLDTRCTYYDQNYEWRKAINFCMKKDGDICWVATRSPRCLAVSSTDTAPALIAMGAKVKLVSASGERTLAVDALYQNDGIDYLTRKPDEILTEVILDDADGWTSTYWKLRRRGSFDFPVLATAAAIRFGPDKTVEKARIVMGAVASRPMVSEDAAELLLGNQLTDDVIEAAAHSASRLAKPMDNTDFTVHWRKRMATKFVTYALRELRGDDMSDTRTHIARHAL